MAKQRNDSDIMLDVLQEAASRSAGIQTGRQDYDDKELPIIIDLIEADLVRGRVISTHSDDPRPQGAELRGITLGGRLYRDTLLKERKERSLLSRLGRYSLVLGGWFAGVATVIIGAGATALFEWVFGLIK